MTWGEREGRKDSSNAWVNHRGVERAISSVMDTSGTRSSKVLANSVKASVGHTESASGMLGLTRLLNALTAFALARDPPATPRKADLTSFHTADCRNGTYTQHSRHKTPQADQLASY